MVLLFVSCLLGQDSDSPKDGEVFGVSTEAPIGGNLLLFDGPSQSEKKIGFISNGDPVKLVRMEGLFAKITCSKFPNGGYVFGKFIRVNEGDEKPGGTGDPTLNRLLRESEDPSLKLDPEKIRPMAPRADPVTVASFIPLIKQSRQP